MSAGEWPQPALQADRWEVRLPGFSYRGSPGDLGEAAPASWSEVWRQVHRHLMRLVSGVPRLLAEAVEGVTRIARSTVPPGAASKVETAHAYADSWEQAQRRLPPAAGVSAGGRKEARRALEAVLERYRRQGHVAGVVAGPGGRPVVVIVPSEAEPSAVDCP